MGGGGLQPVAFDNGNLQPTGRPADDNGLAEVENNGKVNEESKTQRVDIPGGVTGRTLAGSDADAEPDSGRKATGGNGDNPEPIDVQAAEIPEPDAVESENPEPLQEIPEPVQVFPEPSASQIPEPAQIDTEQRTYEIPEPVQVFAGTVAEIPEPVINDPEPIDVRTAEIPEPEAAESEIEINADEVFSKDYRLWNLETYKDRHGKHRAKRVLRFVSKPPKIEIGKITEEIAEELRSRRGKGRWKLSRDEAEEYRGNAELVAESIRRDKGQRDAGSDSRDADRNQDYVDGDSLLPETPDAIQWGEMPAWRM